MQVVSSLKEPGPAPAGATPPAGVRRVGIEALPALALRVLRAALQPLPACMADDTELFIRYVHRKPERGLTVICAAGAPRERAAQGSARPAPPRWITISIDEGALEGARIRLSAQDIQQVRPEGAVAGCVATPSLGFAVQDFPSDRRLSSLGASLSTDLQDPLIGQLELAARACLLDPAWHIRRARAEPVRYKPGSRCVIRYELGLEKRSVNGVFRRELSIFGKVHGDPQRALAIHAAAEQLYAAHRHDGSHPIIPRPLGVAETLGLTLSEAISSDTPEEAPRTGLEVLRPRLRRGVDEPVVRLDIPAGELCAVALALAGLHTSGVSLPGPPRTAAKEALRAAERAALIATHCPLVADSASPRRIQTESAALPGRTGFHCGSRWTLPRRPSARCRLFSGLPAAERTVVSAARHARLVRRCSGDLSHRLSASHHQAWHRRQHELRHPQAGAPLRGGHLIQDCRPARPSPEQSPPRGARGHPRRNPGLHA